MAVSAKSMQKPEPKCETETAARIEREMDKFLETSEKGRGYYTFTWDLHVNSATARYIKEIYQKAGWDVEINSEINPPQTVLTLRQIIVVMPRQTQLFDQVSISCGMEQGLSESSIPLPPGHREIYAEHEERSEPHSNAPKLPGE